jgi:hypothetical protein
MKKTCDGPDPRIYLGIASARFTPFLSAIYSLQICSYHIEMFGMARVHVVLSSVLLWPRFTISARSSITNHIFQKFNT